ncbi:MAG TPA: 6,7-dimethyl-8-ribityllumazine synthase [Dehalococcoidia bacterium]|nr:6,7-dimethyl-8-ribityllumazine synthase [Dehalococcoidia bacterium]
MSIAVVVSRFNQALTEKLLAGAQEALGKCGVDRESADVVWVPGSFELPPAAKWLAESGRYQAIVCLGCVLRGETAHFDYVAGQAATGIGRVALDTGVPVAFGVITADTLQQAVERAGGSSGNKGFDAVLTAVRMANLKAEIARAEKE